MCHYTDHAGLEIPVDLCIASPFSRRIAIGNAGPTSALESMGANPTLPFLKYWSQLQTVSEKKFGLGPKKQEGRKTTFLP